MAITSQADLRSAARQTIRWQRVISANSDALPMYSSAIGGAGGTTFGSWTSPGNTTSGIVPDSTVAGYPTIQSFNGNAGYIAEAEFVTTSAVPLIARLVDVLWMGGPFTRAGSGSYTLSSQPSISGRLPGGSYLGTEIWAWETFAGGGPTAITYTNQSGTTGRATGSGPSGSFTNAPTVGLYPLQAGDSGVQKIEGLTLNTSFGGDIQLMIVRPLLMLNSVLEWEGPNPRTAERLSGPLQTGLPQIYDTSALAVFFRGASVSTSYSWDLKLDVVSG